MVVKGDGGGGGVDGLGCGGGAGGRKGGGGGRVGVWGFAPTTQVCQKLNQLSAPAQYSQTFEIRI